MSLERLQAFVTEANLSNSSNDKKLVIEKYPDCKQYWVYAYDSINYRYGVTSNQLKKKHDKVANVCPYPDLPSILEALNRRDITGHLAISIVNKFTTDNPEYTDLVHCVIDRNLKTRTDAKLINKVFPDTIETFDVALAESYDEKTSKSVTWNGEWLCSRKLDGCRCLVLIDDVGEVTIKSREGLPFLTLGKVIDSVNTLVLTNFVLDGEICMVDENGDEEFQLIMKYIRKKDYTIPNPRFKIFDGLPLDKFEELYYDVPLVQRLIKLLDIIPKDDPVLTLLKQTRMKSIEQFELLRNEAIELGWEGLILRKNAPYQGKRSNDMLKVKKFEDAEYVVDSVVTDTFRYIDPITNLEVEALMLASVSITHKGNPVGVGSGFGLRQRMHFHEHPEEIIGKVITVRYFEETTDENGKKSLRFPTVKVIHGDERTT